MKNLVFVAALALIPALAAVLSVNKRWIGWTFYMMIAGLCLYEETSINFLSYPFYKGTALGMEISLLHLMALAVILALGLRGKWQSPLPEGGIRLYALFFLLCLPGLRNADSVLMGWLEIWKLMMLFVFWHAVYGYLVATQDAKTVVMALALLIIANTLKIIQQHYAFMWTQGLFSHKNTMAMAMNLIGPIFLAGYLQYGLRNRLGLTCAVAFAGAGLCTMWSYSRGAIAMLPLGYGTAVLCSLPGARRSFSTTCIRLAPLGLAGVVGLCAIWPHLVERFQGAPEESKFTRIFLAHCAWEMMKAHPWAGVGVNNWSLNLDPVHPYHEIVEEKLEVDRNFTGIVETAYLLTGAECGFPGLAAMVLWFFWHWVACLKAAWRLRGTRWHFIAAGLSGGLMVSYLQTVLEWVLRQRQTMFLLMLCFGLVAWLRTLRREKELAA